MLSTFVRVFFFIPFLFFLSALFLSAGELPFDCGKYAFSRLDLRYTGKRGMGFDDGYGTASVFIVPNFKRSGIPFFDGRVHVFNNSYLASNLGVGGRLSSKNGKCVFGANVYYDYRNYKSLSSHQAAGGLEILSSIIDFRLNGYYPFSGKYISTDLSFHSFQGNSVFIQHHIRYALPSIDAEFGCKIPLPEPCNELGLYLSAGTYYLFKQSAIDHSIGDVLGGRIRLNINPNDIFSFGGEYTYDALFKSRLNGFVAFHIPLGSRNLKNSTLKIYPYKKSRCDLYVETMKRKTQSVVRNEIIPFYSKNYIHSIEEFPSQFIFVNNQHLAANGIGSGHGTFEDPYTTLALGEKHSQPNDIIYVFFGDGTSRGYDAGFAFKKNQILTSSALDFSLGTIIIPAFTPGRSPIVTNHNAPVITASATKQITVRGFALQGSNNLVVQADSTGITFFKNTLSGQDGFDVFQHTNPTGTTLISENTFNGTSGTFSTNSGVLHISNSAQNKIRSYHVLNNKINAQSSQFAISVENFVNPIMMSNNIINSNKGGIVSNTDTANLTTTTLNILDNNITVALGDGISIINRTNAVVHGTISNNTVHTSSPNVGIFVDHFGEESVCMNISGNANVPGFNISNLGTGFIQVPASPTLDAAGFKNLNNPNGSYSLMGTIFFAPPGSPCAPFAAVFVNNTNTSKGDGSFYNPYQSLALAQSHSAQGDVIYVFYGDGTTKYYDTGFVLQDNQMIVGSGTAFVYKGSIIQPLTPGKKPKITSTNPDLDTISTLETISNCSVIGLDIYSTGNAAISSNASNSSTIANNSISFSSRSDHAAIQIYDYSCSSNNYITDNTISLVNTASPSYTGGITIHGTRTSLIQNNTINNAQTTISAGGLLFFKRAGSTTLNIENNQLIGLNEGLIFNELDTTTQNITVRILNNTFTKNPQVVRNILFAGPSYLAPNYLLDCDVFNNQFAPIAQLDFNASMQLCSQNKASYRLNNNFMLPGTSLIKIYYPNLAGPACITQCAGNNASIFAFDTDPHGTGTGSAQINTTSFSIFAQTNNPSARYLLDYCTFAPPGTPCP